MRSRRFVLALVSAGLVTAAIGCSSDDAAQRPPDESGVSVTTTTTTIDAPSSTLGAVSTTQEDTIDTPSDSTEGSAPPDTLPPMATGVAPTVGPDSVAAGESADELIEPYVRVAAEALGGVDSRDLARVVAVMYGEALDTLRISIAEMEVDGMTRVGIPVVASSEVITIDPAGDPPTAVVDACLDYTGVDVVDTSGKSIVDAGAPKRVLNEFTLQFIDDRWVVTDQTFPVDTVC